MAATETAESLIFYSALAPVVLLLPAVPFTASLPQDALHWLHPAVARLLRRLRPLAADPAPTAGDATALAPYPYLQMVWMIGFGWLDLRPAAGWLDDRRRGDHRGQRAVYRAPRTPAAAEEPHRAQHRRRGVGKKALISAEIDGISRALNCLNADRFGRPGRARWHRRSSFRRSPTRSAFRRRQSRWRCATVRSSPTPPATASRITPAPSAISTTAARRACAPRAPASSASSCTTS